MARRKVQFAPGNYYHVFNRGSNRQAIFRTSENYLFLLRRFREYLTDASVCVIAYCLMPNHYHFLLRQDSNFSIAQLIQSVFNSYGKAFNKMYDRTGTLFEGPYKAVHVNNEGYLIYLCRYIHRNPLEAGLVKDLSNWSFSNYPEWIERRSGNLIDPDFVSAYFKSSAEYEEFVLDSDPPENIQRGLRQFLFD